MPPRQQPRRRAVAILGLMLAGLLLAAPAAAQDSAPRVFLEVSVEPFDAAPDARFLDAVTARLEDAGYAPVVVTDETIGDWPDLSQRPTVPVTFAPDEDAGATTIYLGHYYTLHFERNTTVEPAYDGGLAPVVPAGDADAFDRAVDAAVAMALYAADNCRAAAPRFAALEGRLTLAPDDWLTERGLTFYRGTCALLAADWDGARALLESIAPRTDDELRYGGAIAVNLGFLYLPLNYGNPFRLINRVIERMEGDDAYLLPHFLHKRADLRAQKGQLAKAYADLGRAIRIAEERGSYSARAIAELYAARGQLRLATGQNDAGLADLDRAIAIAPRFAPPYFQRGNANALLRRYREAAADMRAYVEIVPDGPWAEAASDAAQRYAPEDPAPRPLFVEVSYVPAGDASHDAFRARFETGLAANDVAPTFLGAEEFDDYPYFWERPSMHLIVYRPAAGAPASAIRLTPYVTQHLAPSPVLEAAYDVAPGVRLPDDDPAALRAAADLAVGIALYSLGDCEAAVPYLEQAGASDALLPTDEFTGPAMTFYRANCALVAGSVDAARALLESIAPVVDPSLGVGQAVAVNLGWIDVQQGREDALARLDALVEGPVAASSAHAQARALTKRSQLRALDFDFEGAVADMDAAIALAEEGNRPPPALAELYVERGHRILLQYEWDRVLADYDRAIALAPDYAPAYYYRGLLYYTQGPRERALEDFARYLALNPDGRHAEEVRGYVASIEAELEALNE